MLAWNYRSIDSVRIHAFSNCWQPIIIVYVRYLNNSLSNIMKYVSKHEQFKNRFHIQIRGIESTVRRPRISKHYRFMYWIKVFQVAESSIEGFKVKKHTYSSARHSHWIGNRQLISWYFKSNTIVKREWNVVRVNLNVSTEDIISWN